MSKFTPSTYQSFDKILIVVSRYVPYNISRSKLLLKELINTTTSQQKISAESMAPRSTENLAVTITADIRSP
jgi:hypothetical protein